MKTIAHPTDLSPGSVVAFEHALRLAIENRCGLDVLHVKPPGADDAWAGFPRVRDTLQRWGLLAAGAARSDVEERLGVRVRKVEIGDRDSEHGVLSYFARHRPDLVVLATHGATGLAGWLTGSVSEAIARDTHLPTLFIGPSARPFVDSRGGAMRLESIVFGAAAKPSPQEAVHLLGRLLGDRAAGVHYVHVGERPLGIVDGDGRMIRVEAVAGPVVDTLLGETERLGGDLLVMVTEGHHGFLDALRGSTTERVLHRARCPVLALPAGATT